MNESAMDESDGEVCTILPGEEDQLIELMSAPLTRALDAWNHRVSEGPLPAGVERGDLDDRVEEEIWLLGIHGYGPMASSGPYGRRSGRVRASDTIRAARFAYDVYSLEELGIPQMARPHQFPAPASGVVIQAFPRAGLVVLDLGSKLKLVLRVHHFLDALP